MTPREFKQWCQDWHHQQRSNALIMGILNVTPDSFSDGGCYLNLNKAKTQIARMLAEGADIIDVGGESSRPGAKSVSVDEELSRVLPVIEAIREQSDCVISIDTVKAEVMSAAVAAGANMINDISALTNPASLKIAAEVQVPLCLMHMQGIPQTMQKNPEYPEGVLPTLLHFYKERYETCQQAGIARENIIFDPGFGFGKTLRHNLILLKELRAITNLAAPILLGVSRKSTLGAITGEPVQNRSAAGIAVAAYALTQGVAMIRTHDVAQTKQALLMMKAINQAEDSIIRERT